jgi:hypothetical protein
MPLPFSVGSLGSVTHTTDPVTIIDYPSYVSVQEIAGAQSSSFGTTPVTTYNSPLGTGVTDDSAAINGAFTILANGGFGQSLYFPAGTYLVTANAIVTNGVPVILAPGATFTGTYASTITLAAANSALSGTSVAGFARAVITTIPGSQTGYSGTTTNTITFTGGTAAALGTQDGITTLAVGDCVILPPGTTSSFVVTNCDSGPWIISVLGVASGARTVLKRPSWFQTGTVIPIGYQVLVGPEGSVWANVKWTSWANTPASATIAVGATTTNPLWYPDHVATLITLASGFFTQTTVPIRSLTQTSFAFLSASYSGGSTTAKFTTGAISSGGAATAIGGVGTGSVSITAIAVAGTVVAGDISTGWLHIWNRA